VKGASQGELVGSSTSRSVLAATLVQSILLNTSFFARTPEVRHSLQALKGLCTSARVDLIVLRIEVDRDLGPVERSAIALGQGYLLGRPRDVGTVSAN
jgi:EAL domain-containing protein (putative c-di-GMP-specific phosphodiesterase class I)